MNEPKDLLARLRRALEGDNDQYFLWETAKEAADEIDRLRAENSELNAESLRVGAENMELRRELERLKAVTHDLVEAALRSADETAACQHDYREYSINNAKSPLDAPELFKWVKCIKCGLPPVNGTGGI